MPNMATSKALQITQNNIFILNQYEKSLIALRCRIILYKFVDKINIIVDKFKKIKTIELTIEIRNKIYNECKTYQNMINLLLETKKAELTTSSPTKIHTKSIVKDMVQRDITVDFFSDFKNQLNRQIERKVKEICNDNKHLYKQKLDDMSKVINRQLEIFTQYRDQLSSEMRQLDYEPSNYCKIIGIMEGSTEKFTEQFKYNLQCLLGDQSSNLDIL